MAVYHLSAKVIQRSHGRSAVAAAAYRAAAALHDEAAGRTSDYEAKPGVIHSEIMLPAGAPDRWLDRETLWNEVERIERRWDAVLAREIELSLPRELSPAEAIRLAGDFSRTQFVARGMVADLNVHWGQSADGAPQPHAHVMLPMRRIVPGPGGWPEQGAFGLKERGWNDHALLHAWRAAWADLVNARLAEAGFDTRVDHRSHAVRGIDLEPQNKIGPAGARRAVREENAERADEHRAIARRNGARILADPGLALQALTEQQSTFTRHDLARLVHRQSDGAAQFAAIMAKVEASPELVRVGADGRERDRYSTREMVAIERRMEATALALSRRTTHAVAVGRRRPVLMRTGASGTGPGTGLGEEQQVAFGHVTRSRNLAVVVGYAGTGKSTMLGVARQAWEAEGYTVRGAALSGIAAEGLEGGSGITSRTIASWEYAWARGKEHLTARDVLVVDEAGMIGSRQMARVLAAVQAAGAKLVLVGDHEQLQAIEAGAAFRAIVERVGAVEITQVRRQHAPWQRAATGELATGRTGEALDRYAAAGMVFAHATEAAAREALIAGWQAARRRAPEESQIILTHTRDDVRQLNEQARAIRREAGELGTDHVLPTELGPRRFAVGDRVYFLRNERSLGAPGVPGGPGVKNGTLGTITEIARQGEGAQLVVKLDRDDPGSGKPAVVRFGLAEYAHLDHGYAATVHKSQGVTVDRTHVLATPGMDRHLAYVALTRHRQGLALHWSEEVFGSRDGLATRLGRERAKDTTLDYGESAAELAAAYAARRGLHPVAAPTAVAAAIPVVAATRAPATKTGETTGQPRRAWRNNAQRTRLARALRPVLPAVQAVLERQGTMRTSLAGAIGRLAQRQTAAAPPPPLLADASTPSSSARPSIVAPKPTRSRGSARRALAATVQPSPLPERWPWTGLDDVPPASPLLRAEPHRWGQSHDLRGEADDAVRSMRRHLERSYARAYQDPQHATASFVLLEATLGTEAARARVARNPGVLGSLRGGWLTAEGRKEREQALAYGRGVAAGEQALHQAEEQTRRNDAMAEERRRRQQAIEVPGLSAKAQAAIRALADAGATPGWVPHELSERVGPVVETVLDTAKVASLYEAIRADGPLLAELTRFEDAVARRLAHGGRVGPRSRQAPGAERQAERSHDVMVAARARHAWHPVLQEHVAAQPRLRFRVEHAEQMQLSAARRAQQRPEHDPMPRPSPGPSFGPGM